jgi:hypothetical protein
MGDSEPSDSDLSLEECVAKAREWRSYHIDPELIWEISAEWAVLRSINCDTEPLLNFLHAPESAEFSMFSRTWRKNFLKLHQGVAMRRMRM